MPNVEVSYDIIGCVSLVIASMVGTTPPAYYLLHLEVAQEVAVPGQSHALLSTACIPVQSQSRLHCLMARFCLLRCFSCPFSALKELKVTWTEHSEVTTPLLPLVLVIFTGFLLPAFLQHITDM